MSYAIMELFQKVQLCHHGILPKTHHKFSTKYIRKRFCVIMYYLRRDWYVTSPHWNVSKKGLTHETQVAKTIQSEKEQTCYKLTCCGSRKIKCLILSE